MATVIRRRHRVTDPLQNAAHAARITHCPPTSVRFRYQSELRLFQYLGEYDAFVELDEVALRRFEHEANEAEDLRSFVRDAATAHRIRVNVDTLAGLRVNASRTHIVVVHQSADQFLVEFQREHERLHGMRWKPPEDGVSPLKHALSNLGMKFSLAEKELGTIRCELFEYYRAVRNLVTHRDDPADDDDEASTDPGVERAGRRRRRLDRQLSNFCNAFAEELPAFRKRLDAPNAIDDVHFDDFVLCTRNLKEIACAMSRLGTPSDSRILASIQDAIDRFYGLEPHNPERVRRRIATEIRSRHGVDRLNSERIASLWEPEPAY